MSVVIAPKPVKTGVVKTIKFDVNEDGDMVMITPDGETIVVKMAGASG